MLGLDLTHVQRGEHTLNHVSHMFDLGVVLVPKVVHHKQGRVHIPQERLGLLQVVNNVPSPAKVHDSEGEGRPIGFNESHIVL